MLLFIQLLSLFAAGATGGWMLEVVYRCWRHGRLINPGFLSGCALPIYGVGVLVLFIFRFTMIDFGSMWLNILAIFLGGAIIMTLIELIGGFIAEKYYHVKLWDYTEEKWNYKGLICPKFSVYWGLCCLLFCKLLYPSLYRMVSNATDYGFILFVGFYYGILCVDTVQSLGVMEKIRARAIELERTIDIEKLKLKTKEQLEQEHRHALRIHVFQNLVLAEYLERKQAEANQRRELVKEKQKEIDELREAIILDQLKVREKIKESLKHEDVTQRIKELLKQDDLFPKV